MRGAVTVFRRELAGLFLSPLAWILLFVSLLANGFFFFSYLQRTGNDVTASLEGALGGGYPFWAFLVFLPPLLTMRMLSEESRSGTLEYLLTAPISDAAVIVGKFLAATAFLAILWVSVPVYALAIQATGGSPDWGGVFGGYVGAVLTSALFVAIGLLTSSLTNTPILAAFIGFVACLWWLILPMVGGLVLRQAAALFAAWPDAVEVAERWVRGALEKMDVTAHFQASFQRGVIDTAEFVFFLTWTAMFLFLTVRSLEARRWRG